MYGIWLNLMALSVKTGFLNVFIILCLWRDFKEKKRGFMKIANNINVYHNMIIFNNHRTARSSRFSDLFLH